VADIIYRFHLNFPNCSGRAIQFKLLSESEQRAAQVAAARAVSEDKNALGLEVRLLEQREAAKRMITHITEGPAQPPINDATPFKAINALEMERDFDKLFAAYPKDVAVLSQLYTKFHELTMSEVSDIEGKLIPVSLG
jgi:hypothetical protein